MNCGVPQGFVLRPLLFLLYINDLNQAIKFCKVHYFADHTSLLYLGKSIKKLNKPVDFDLKYLVYWLNAWSYANKIPFNVKKDELVICKSKWKQFDSKTNRMVNRKWFFRTDSVKYLGVKIDRNLSWKSHIDYLSVKLNRASALLFKMRNILNWPLPGRLYSATRMRSSRLKKSHNFQRLPLFSIFYNDFLKFSESRDKEFKLGQTYFNFPLTGNYITSCTLVI